jgi:transposase
VLLAGDEASLYLQATWKVVWSPTGQTPVVRLDPSRKSTHFYGALNLTTGSATVLRSPVMHGEVSALFLQKLLMAYPDKPILLFWDRAPWHRGVAIQQLLADTPRLQIVFFPPGAPDLNPQEHVWKDARSAVSHNHAFTKLDALADSFEHYLTHTAFPCSLLHLHSYYSICPSFI